MALDNNRVLSADTISERADITRMAEDRLRHRAGDIEIVDRVKGDEAALPDIRRMFGVSESISQCVNTVQ